MKKTIVSLVVLLIIVGLLSVCNGSEGVKQTEQEKTTVSNQDKPADEKTPVVKTKVQTTGERFETTNFSFVIPDGYKAESTGQDNYVVVLKETDRISSYYNSSESGFDLSSIINSLTNELGSDKVKVEKTTYGKYEFTRIEFAQSPEYKTNFLFCQKDTGVLGITCQNMNSAVMTVLNTLEIK